MVRPKHLEKKGMKRRTQDDDNRGTTSKVTLPPNKKRKSDGLTVGSPPLSTQDVASTMLPSEGSSKKTLDQSIFALGQVERWTIDTLSDTVSFFLVSIQHPDDSVNHDYAEIFVVLKGPWTRTLLERLNKRQQPGPSATAVLAFKQVKLAHSGNSKTNTLVGTSKSKCIDTDESANFTGYYLLFEKGVELWIQETTEITNTPEETNKGVASWHHLKLFAEAQRLIGAPHTYPVDESWPADDSFTKSASPALPSLELDTASKHPTIAGDHLHDLKPSNQAENDISRLFNNPIAGASAAGPSGETKTADIGTSTSNAGLQPARGGLHEVFATSAFVKQDISTFETQSHGTLPVVKKGSQEREPSLMRAETPATIPQVPAALPFLSIAQLRVHSISDETVAVTGVVAQEQNKPKSNAYGHTMVLALVDETVAVEDQRRWMQGDRLSFSFLNPKDNVFPTLELGDVLLVRQAKTVIYNTGVKTYTRAHVTPDQPGSWIVLSLRTYRALKGKGTSDRIPLEHYVKHPATQPPSEAEQAKLLELANWSLQASGDNFWKALDSSPRARTWTDIAPQALLTFADIPPTIVESPPISCIGKIVQGPWIDDKKITLGLADYTANRILANEGHLPPADNLTNDMMLRVLIWKNGDFGGTEEKFASIVDSLQSNRDAIFHIRGIRLRAYNGIINANCRSNLPEFALEVLEPDDARAVAIFERRDSFLASDLREMKRSSPPIDDSGYHSRWDMPDQSGVDVPQRQGDRQSVTTSEFFAGSFYELSPSSVTQKPDRTRLMPLPTSPQHVQPAARGSTNVGTTKASQEPLKSVPAYRRATLKKLQDLGAPSGGQGDYFNCACEVVEDVHEDPYSDKILLAVTDFTVNQAFWLNQKHWAYPQAKIIFNITLYGIQARQIVKDLKQGQRIVLEGVRVKLDRQGNLEGHVGERSAFRMNSLKEGDKEHTDLQDSRKILLNQLDPTYEEKEVVPSATSKTYAGVACKFAGLRVDDGIFAAVDDPDRDGIFRVRGRVVEIGPKEIGQFTSCKCLQCDRFLTREEALCRHCPDGVLGNNLVRYWNFSLRVELEPADCNIDCDPIEEERCQWINVLEQEGDTIFMNGLEPSVNVPSEAHALLRGLVHSPSSGNGTNPVFDFCIKKRKGIDFLVLAATALVRESHSLPWIK